MPPKNEPSEADAKTEEQKMSTYRGKIRTKRGTSCGEFFANLMREIGDFLINNSIMLIVLVVVVCWQTKVFGMYSTKRINERKRQAAEAEMPFGEVSVKNIKYMEGEEGRRIVGGDYVTAQVTGWDQRGFQFFSTRNKQQSTGPLVVAVSSGRSIIGLEEALLHMRVGETATARIPPDLAFGSRGKRSWNIEPWSILTLEITALSATKEKPADPPEIPVARKKPKEEPQKTSTPEITSTDTTSAEDSLAAFLEKSGMGKFHEKLERIGFTSLEDFSLLEPDDLPEDLPTFAKKKLLAIARKLKDGKTEGVKPEQAAKKVENEVEEKKEPEKKVKQEEKVKESKQVQNDNEPDTCSSEGTC
eukprot:TRINITY_DN5738_c4_g1_i1.p1 TRINITY_DN5738_c4_g1~~TRINITY_DN5738_c4_g1_i1.p1  ORF type:complete len:381 (+),score=91.03 TRINITY_DN5738_c4_g1_i1:65-1144(+)